jgi:hypothetical protein
MGLKKPLTISHPYEVVTPAQEIAYPIPKADWEHIKKRIKRLKFDTPIYQNIGSCLLGIGASSLICAYTYPQPIPVTSTFTYYSLLVVGFVCLIVGGICWAFDCSLKKIKKTECNDIIEEMEANEPPLV